MIRSSRKTLAVEIACSAQVIVRSPLFCPQEEIHRFLERHADWAEKNVKRQKQFLAAHPEPDAARRALLIARAEAELPPRIWYYGKIMGLCPAGIKITGARKRFGSCSDKNRLCFSWRLMQYPDAAVDCVIVHELAHLVHKNHGPQFYALMASILPDYKERQKLLQT